uniref:Prion-inhibition and propagation HeLo domain-containing protein n=1 Tax=Fusarium oxysporum (strain Fo5176) TaxID=660025 RepID=A0A0D2Y9H0_FUSOF
MVQRIAAVVTQCIDCFGKIVRAPTTLAPSSPTFGKDMADQQTRFNVWAGNIGAHRTGLSSLDYRLRDSSQIEDQVLSLLKDLIELMQDAHNILMGNEVPWDKINAGDDEDFDGRDTELNQISVDIADVHVSSKFRTIENLLAERLGKAIIRRRQFFNYRLAHRTKLSQGLTHEGGDAETIASSLPEYLKDVARGGQPLPINAIGDEGSDSGCSQTSYATSLAGLDQC